MDVAAGVRKVMRDQFPVTDDKLVDTTTLGDLDADSLDVVELVMGLEEEFNIAIDDDEASEKLGGDTTLKGMCEFVTAKLDEAD